MSLRIKKGDQVEVITGRDKGKRGSVLAVLPQKGRALVEGINMIKKHRRARGADKPGGIISLEAPIHLSNIMLIDPDTDEPTRFRSEVRDGKKVRVSVKSGKVL
jgi:large subunit ribosomal protein L24